MEGQVKLSPKLLKLRKTYEYLKLLENAQEIEYSKRSCYNGRSILGVVTVKGTEMFYKEGLEKRISIVKNYLKKRLDEEIRSN